MRLIFLSFIFFLNSCSSQLNNFECNGTFEGTEPFWDISITGSKYILTLKNKTYTGNLIFSTKANRGETYSFRDNKLFGVINKSACNYCEYAITEEDSLKYEIYLNVEDIVYKGCGSFEKKGSR